MENILKTSNNQITKNNTNKDARSLRRRLDKLEMANNSLVYRKAIAVRDFTTTCVQCMGTIRLTRTSRPFYVICEPISLDEEEEIMSIPTTASSIRNPILMNNGCQHYHCRKCIYGIIASLNRERDTHICLYCQADPDFEPIAKELQGAYEISYGKDDYNPVHRYVTRQQLIYEMTEKKELTDYIDQI